MSTDRSIAPDDKIRMCSTGWPVLNNLVMYSGFISTIGSDGWIGIDETMLGLFSTFDDMHWYSSSIRRDESGLTLMNWELAFVVTRLVSYLRNRLDDVSPDHLLLLEHQINYASCKNEASREVLRAYQQLASWSIDVWILRWDVWFVCCQSSSYQISDVITNVSPLPSLVRMV